MNQNPFASPSALLGATGNQKIIENVGAKRIVGTELLSLGKVPQFVYYLTDISSICFYANDGTDTWIGGFGQPVAGSLTLRESLQPFQGQRFYVIATDISYTYKGGAWEGGVIQANTLAPTTLILEEGTDLTRGRNHLANADGIFKLPPVTSTTLGGTLQGHHLELFVARGVTGAVLSAHIPSEEFVIDVVSTNYFPLQEGSHYIAIFRTTQWEIFYVEVDGFLPSTTQVIAGTGLLHEGTLEGGTVLLRADFATSVEAADPNNVSKLLNPSHLPDAVAVAARASQFNNITGLSPLADESQFLLVRGTDSTKVAYPKFTVVFNTDPYLRTAVLAQRTFAAGFIQLPNTAGNVVYYAAADINGVISLSATKSIPSVVDFTHLGAILAINGEIGVIGGNDQLFTTVWLASSAYGLRYSQPELIGGVISPSATVGKVIRDSVKISMEGVNWESNPLNPHLRTLVGTDPTSWTYINALGVISTPNPTDLVKADLLGNGAVVGNNNYSIQIAYITIEGTMIVLLGQTTYATIISALASVENYTPALPSGLSRALELSRWVIKGDQFSGSIQYDLTSSTNFVASAGSSIGGGAVSTTAADVTATTLNNSLVSTNLQVELDELSGRTSWEWMYSPSAINPLHMQVVALGTGGYTLPPIPPVKHFIKLTALFGAVPVFTSENPAVNFIKSANASFPDDTQFTINAPDSGKIYTLLSDGTHWIL
jgi:hypothetical protein